MGGVVGVGVVVGVLVGDWVGVGDGAGVDRSGSLQPERIASSIVQNHRSPFDSSITVWL